MVEVSRSHTMRRARARDRAVRLLWTSAQHITVAATYTIHKKHKTRTFMPSAGFDPAVSAKYKLQNYAFYRTATDTGIIIIIISSSSSSSNSSSIVITIIIIIFINKGKPISSYIHSNKSRYATNSHWQLSCCKYTRFDILLIMNCIIISSTSTSMCYQQLRVLQCLLYSVVRMSKPDHGTSPTVPVWIHRWASVLRNLTAISFLRAKTQPVNKLLVSRGYNFSLSPSKQEVFLTNPHPY